MVFTDRRELPRLERTRVPTYLDLAETLTQAGPRFTFPAALIQALAQRYRSTARGPRVVTLRALRSRGPVRATSLRRVGLPPVAQECHAGPTISTFTAPQGLTSQDFVDICRRWGFLVGGQSAYLAERRLVQIATMGAITRAACGPLFRRLE